MIKPGLKFRSKFGFTKRGFALLITIGVLAILSMIGTAFVLSNLAERRQAANYKDSLKAKYLAEAGIALAIAELKAETTVNFEDTLNEAWGSGYDVAAGDGTYTVAITDEQRKININNADQQLLDNLPGITSTMAAAIISYRTSRPFIVPEELKLVPGITPAIYDNISDYVTVNSYVDTHFNRSPVNVNTAPLPVLKAVFEGVSNGSSTISSSTATALANHLIDDRSSAPFGNWNDFDASLDSSTDITGSEAALIKDNCNPNNTKPSTYTTELCFNSGGVYNLLSTGKVLKGGIQVASAQKQAVVRIFNMWNQTTKEEFMQPWLDNPTEAVDFSLGDIVWVNWMDSCPIDSSQNWDTGPYDAISNALKLGYWDNFDEYRQYYSADHINDWTSWYWGTGYIFIDSMGRLYTNCGPTQSNLCYQYPARYPTISNCNRWNTANRDCTISMQSGTGRNAIYKTGIPGQWGATHTPCFYYRRWQNSNSDTHLFGLSEPLVCNWDGSLTSSGIAWTFYWVYVNNDEAYQTFLTQLSSKSYRLVLEYSGSFQYGSYLPIPAWSDQGPGKEAARVTLRLNADNTVAGAWLSLGTIGGSQSIGYSTQCNSGPVVGAYWGWVDNVRIIPGKKSPNTWNGRYVSTPLNLSSQVTLGSVTGTVTIPSSASASSETVDLCFCPDGSSDIPGTKVSGGDMTNKLQYVAYFYTDNANLYETPVLEDVTITYLDGVKILYSR